MSYKSSNKRETWESYCSKHSDFIDELNLNEWVFDSENNFREFVTHGSIHNTKDTTYSFQKLSHLQYENLFDFITNYFDMDMQYFTNFNRTV